MCNKIGLRCDFLRCSIVLVTACFLVESAYAAPKMYWSELIGNVIKYANLDGSGISPVGISTGTNPLGIDLDTEAAKLYWTEFTDRDIERADLNGANPQQVYSDGTHQPVSVAVDTVNNKVYWTDVGMNRIRISNLDLTSPTFFAVSAPPYGLALDVPNGYLYWTEGAGATGAIKRSSLSGTGVITVVSTGGGSTPLGLALDQAAGILYFADDGLNLICKVNTSGTGLQFIVSGLDKPFDVDLTATKVYWVDSATNKISRANKDGSSVEDVISSGLSSPSSLVLLGNAEPVANIGGPYSINEGDTLNLDASASSDPDGDTITLVEWEFDNDALYDEGIGATLAQNWASLAALGWNDGVYPISVRVSDGTDTGIANGSVTVNNLPPNIVHSGPYTINEGSSLVLDATGTSDPGGDALTYSWDLDDDTNTDVTGINPTVPWSLLQTLGLTNGLHNMRLLVNDGVISVPAIISLSIQNLPPIGQPDSYTVNANAILNISATGVLTNDTDPGSDALTVGSFDTSSAAGAVVNVSANGAFTYDPRFVPAFQALLPAEELIDTFQYTVFDGSDIDLVLVEVRVIGVIGPPPMPISGGAVLLFTVLLLAGCGLLLMRRSTAGEK